MRISAFSILALGFGLVSVQLSACGTSTEDCSATATCTPTAGSSSAGSSGKSSGGNDAGGEAGAPPSSGGSQNTGGSGGSGSGAGGAMGGGGEGGAGMMGCTGDVADDAECWTTNELGVFVSSEHGDDANDGTKEHPFATLKAGVAASAGKNVYVCLGDNILEYDEQLVIDKSMDGLRIYGGFSCEDWSYDAERKPLVHPSGLSGMAGAKALPMALRILGVKKGVKIESMRFQAADATGTGLDASSYGAFITDSTNVVLKGVTLTAGAGMKGEDQTQPVKANDGKAATAAQDGEAASCTANPPDSKPGKWDAAICGSKGGTGGIGTVDANGGSGLSGSPALNVTPANTINLGAGSIDGTHGGDGTDGSPGNAGASPKDGPSQGMFAVVGFTPAGGADGGNGFPGQGGGGGGASKGNATCRGASGGAGGMGGCGGTAGKGGGGGGASVGLLNWNSQITLIQATISSASGGAGGKGGNGGDPGEGAAGGTFGAGGGGIARGGTGGPGGKGGPGGNGAGGSGGPSFAIVFSGIEPSYDEADTTLKPGTGGAKGLGGTSDPTKAPDGSVGDEGKRLEVK